MYSVILVDDEKMIKRSLLALIEGNETGFKVVGEAKDGEEALSLNEQCNPDLIITDIRMPKMNGLKFIKKVKDSNRKSKFIIISGYDQFEYAQEAIRYGVVDFLLKPIKPEQFLSSLEKVHQQISGELNSTKERGECLGVIKPYTEKLVQQLWLLEEKEVNRLIHEYHECFKSFIGKKHSIRSMYADFLIYFKSELEKQSHSFNEENLLQVSDIPDEELEIKETIMHMCQNILEQLKTSRNIGHRNNILTTVKYIDEHYAVEDLSLVEVADTIGMSPSYFSMEFKAEMGISFKQYVTKLRIEKAKELLNNPTYKTYEVAFATGYGDYPHFTKTFKKLIGITPSQYRKRIGVTKETN